MNPGAVRGHLDGLILSVLEQGPMHGYAVKEELSQRSQGALDFPTGSLYPALRRLERAGYLSGTWDESSARKRRTYELTASGRRALEREREQWNTFNRSIGAVMAPRLG